MKPFQVEHYGTSGLHFWLHLDEKIRVTLDYNPEAKFLKWGYEAFIPEYTAIRLWNKKFCLYVNNNAVEEKINQGFYNLLRQIKHHPKYRLRVINTLDENMREIWNTI